MPKFDEVLQVRLGSLESAVTDWTSQVTKLRNLKTEAEAMYTKSKKADWRGENAAVTRPFVTKTAKEFGDALKQAESVRNVLETACIDFLDARTKLNKIVDETAPAQELRVDPFGTVRIKIPDHPAARNDPDAPGNRPNTAAENAKIAELQREVDACVRKADAADSAAEKALRSLIRDPHNFSDREYASTGDARKAQVKADEAVELAKKKEDLTETELNRLNTTLKTYGDNPVFAERFATGLGPRGTLEFWAGVADPPTATPNPKRVEQLRELQKNVGVTLGEATKSHSPAMEKWKQDIIKLGDERLGIDDAGDPYGFQVMSNLMRSGEYDGEFLKDYGAALVKADVRMNGDLPPSWTTPPGYSTNLDYLAQGDTGKDPVTGFMQALSRTPDASTDFFHSSVPIEKDSGERMSVTEYFLKERDYPDDGELPSGAKNALVTTGMALYAAGSGMDPSDPDAQAMPHTPEQNRVFDRSLQYLSERGDDFPSELRGDMAKLIVNHGRDVHETTSDVDGNTPLNSSQLMEVMKQVSKDQDAYGHMNEGMNHILVDSFHGDGKPEDTLDKAGRTIGYLEEARQAGLSSIKDADNAQAAWDKNWRYHTTGAVLGTIPYVGDVAQRGADMVTYKMMEDEQARIGAEFTEDSQEAHSGRKRQLAALTDEWYEINGDWAREETGYSDVHGAKAKIGEAADAGSHEAQGVSGRRD